MLPVKNRILNMRYETKSYPDNPTVIVNINMIEDMNSLFNLIQNHQPQPQSIIIEQEQEKEEPISMDKKSKLKNLTM